MGIKGMSGWPDKRDGLTDPDIDAATAPGEKLLLKKKREKLGVYIYALQIGVVK